MVKKDDLDKLTALRAEIEALKEKRPTQRKMTATPDNVMESMDKLTSTLNDFMQTFEQATEDMRLEEKEEELFIKELKPLHEKMDQIVEQNEKIAKGIIAVANMLNSDIPFIKRMVAAGPGQKKPVFEQQMPQFGTMPLPQRPMAPKPMMPLTGAPMPPPPKPKIPEQKKRFSDLFKQGEIKDK